MLLRTFHLPLGPHLGADGRCPAYVAPVTLGGPMAGSPASRVEVSSGQGVNVDDPVGALQKLIGRVQFEPIDPE